MTAELATYAREVSGDVVARAKQVVREAGAGADPLVVARTLMSELGEEAQTLLSMCLLVWVEREMTPGARRMETFRRGASSSRPNTASVVRTWYAEVMDQHVDLGNERFKRFGNCTPADLRLAAVRRIEIATAQASRWGRLAEHMERTGVSTVQGVGQAKFTELVGAEAQRALT